MTDTAEEYAGYAPPDLTTEFQATFNANGAGAVYQALNQRISTYTYLGEPVLQVQVPANDQRACDPGRYVLPRLQGQFEEARSALLEYGVVVLSATHGNGRRTTALRLLREAEIGQGDMFDLEPEWQETKASLLPQQGGHGYVLDLSDVTALRSRFGSELVAYGRDGLPEHRYLVVLADPEHWAGDCAEATLKLTVKITSPHAKNIVISELKAVGEDDRVDWLDAPELAKVWNADPPVREARRLARILAGTRRETLAVAVDEFTGWHDHIDRMLNRPPGRAGEPGLLSTRTTMWAGALLDGQQVRSVLAASDWLLAYLGVDRSPAEVLADATSMRRLSAAGLIVADECAHHDRDKHNLAAAILLNLWEQFPTQRTLLRDWAVSVAADPRFNDDDAERVTSALLDLATRRGDGEILDGIAAGLVGRRRYLAVRALTAAALSAEMGPFVRQQLYTWAKNTKSADRTRLIVDICAGEFGVRMPDRALTRLRWATGRSDPGSPQVVTAFERLLAVDPQVVGKAVEAWLGDENLDESVLRVFLALVSGEAGPAFLVGKAGTENGRVQFVRAWRGLLDDVATTKLAEDQLTRWSELAKRGELPDEVLISLFADVYRHDLANSKVRRFLGDEDTLGASFWGRVLTTALSQRRQGPDPSEE